MIRFHPINWNLVKLSQNPFHPTSEQVIWAGFPKLKGQLEALFSEALTRSKTQVILNWGDEGSGKTHAATYFGSEEVLANLTEPIAPSTVRNVFSFYIQTPREPEQANLLFYQNLIEAIRFKRIRTVMSEIGSVGEKRALERMQQIVDSEALGRALWLFGQEKNKSGQQRLFQPGDAFSEWHLLLESYLFSQTTKRDLRRLGLSRGINSAQDRFKVLSAILQSLIGLDAKHTDQLTPRNRVILWLDEIETLIHYPSRYYDLFIQLLQDLIDQLPHYFTILINFSVESKASLEHFEVFLGKALLDRVTRSVYFQEANEEEAFQYVRELLAFYRPPSWEVGKLPDVYPFSQEALRILISGLHPRTPGNLNRQLTDVISQALQRGVISSPGEGIIDKQFILTLKEERLKLDIGYGYGLR